MDNFIFLSIEMEKIIPYLHVISVASFSAFLTVLFLPKINEIVRLKEEKKDTPVEKEKPIDRLIIKGFNGHISKDLVSLKSKDVTKNNEIIDNSKQEKTYITYRLFKDGSRSEIIVSIPKKNEIK